MTKNEKPEQRETAAPRPARLPAIARALGVTIMGVAVLIVTADGFAQSYAGLYRWALEHGLAGWHAQSFPLLVDSFVLVGEIALFLLAIDGYRFTRSATSWLDLLLPAGSAGGGWLVSLAFNVGHVGGGLSVRITAAVPPLAAMLGLLVLLRTLHRYVARADTAAEPAATAVMVPAPAVELAAEPAAACEPETGLRVIATYLPGDPVPDVPGEPDPLMGRARQVFADELADQKTPSIRHIKKRMQVGQERARDVRAHLAELVAQ